MPSVEVLHARGVAALNRGRHATARRLLERARTLAAEDDLLARIDGSLAYVLSETGQGREALELCRSALNRSDIAEATRGLLYRQVGLIQMLRGDGEAALAAFDRAVELLDNDGARGRVHLNRGNVYLQRHDLRSAANDFTEAGASYRRAGDLYGAAKATHNLGYVRFCEGDLVVALKLMAAAYPRVAEQGPVMAAMVDQDRAEALLAAGLVREGRDALHRAAKAYSRRRLYQRQGEAELTLARTAVQSDPRVALTAARRARDNFERSDAQTWRLRAEAEMLAAEIERGRPGRDHVGRSDRVSQGLSRQKLFAAASMVRLQCVRGLLQLGDVEGARRRLRRIRVDRTAPLAVRLIDRDVRAAVAQAAGRRRAALDHLRAGLSDLHDWQSSFGSLDLQTNVVGHGTRLGVRGLALAVDSGSTDVLFEWSERARMLASRVQPVRAPQDEQTVADLTELRAGPTPEREAELRQQIRERAWQRKGSGEVADPVSLTELQAGLGPGTTLMAHVVTADRVVALVVTDGSATRHDLGDRAGLEALLGGLLPDLDMASSDLPGPMAGVVLGELAERLDRLAGVLIEPLIDDVGDRSVVLTPSGLLAGVPWTLLPGLIGRPVTVAQSATSWLARRTTPLRTGVAGFVAGPRVARAAEEVTAAGAGWAGARVLTGDEATCASVSELACEVDVLHLAAHGKHSSENPLFSGLQLVDGAWFGYDIDQLTAVPDVVILSACEVGRSSVRAGEELIGMTAAWLHAGARCVIASAAAVSDEVAHDVLTTVHEQLARGVAPDVALAGAVPAVDADRPPAPFVCFG